MAGNSGWLCMPLFRRALLVWTEPLAYGRIRANESRRKWPFGIYAVGPIWAGFGVLSAMVRTQYDPPPRPISLGQWLGCWVGGSIGLTAVIWAVSFIPLRGRVSIYKDSVRAGNRTIYLRRVKSISWENKGEFWVVTFEMQSGSQREFGVPLEIQPKVAEALKRFEPRA